MDSNTRKIAQEELKKEIKHKAKVTAYRGFTSAKYLAIAGLVLYSENIAYKNQAHNWIAFIGLQTALAVVFITTVTFMAMLKQSIQYGLKDNLDGLYNMFYLGISNVLVISLANTGIFGLHTKIGSLCGVAIGVLMLIHLFGHFKRISAKDRLSKLGIKIKIK